MTPNVSEFQYSQHRPMLRTHVDSTGAYPSPCVTREAWQELERLGHHVQAGIMKFLNPPVVYQGVQCRLEVAEPE